MKNVRGIISWRAFFSCNICFEIRPFTLLPTIISSVKKYELFLNDYCLHCFYSYHALLPMSLFISTV